MFRRTISEENLRAVRVQCSGDIPSEFRGAEEDFDKKAKVKFLLQQKFSIRRKYKLVGLSRVAPSLTEEQVQNGSISDVFSVSAVGFDETRTYAIALVRYMVHEGGTKGGDSTFHLLRKTEKAWQEAPEITRCGRIY